MEHEKLKNKIESLDLSKMEGLQWDEERAWARLNSQMQATNQKSVGVWYYALAASVVILIAFVSGYILLQHSDSSGNGIMVNEIQVADNSKVEEQQEEREEHMSLYNQLEGKGTVVDEAGKESIEVTIVKKEPVIEAVANQLEETKQTNIDLEELIPVGQSDHLAVRQKETVVNEPDKVFQEEMLISSFEEGISQVNEVNLSSVPIEQKKNKLSIKLFQKKKTSKSKSVDKLPALTLFASK